MSTLPSWISQDSAVWFSFFTVLLTAMLSAVRQDNPAFPIVLSARGKVIFTTIITVLEAVLHEKMSGISWTQSIVLAVTSSLTALGGHGFRNTISLPPTGGIMNQSGTVVVPSSDPPVAVSVKDTPTAMTMTLRFLGAALLAILVLITIAAMTGGCTPAQEAKWSQIEAKVHSDVEAGDTLQQIETDVAAIAIGVLPSTIVTIVDDAIVFLEDAGAFSLLALPRAEAMHTQLLVAKASLHVDAGR